MVKGFGLNPRARLLGQSRGALYHYNWAADHPECVDRLAQIYPVCDLSRAPVSFDRLAEAYGMSAAGLQEQLSAHNPIERLAPLVAAGIPIFHVHGDADAVVPLAQHSTELARRYQALGGEIELLVVHGQGHEEVDAFFKCQALVDFLTRE
jgi:pimeloyl-ACP methyl ester carboxylesterase